MLQRTRCTTSNSERGSFLIEASLTAILYFGLLFLLIDLSLALFFKATLQQAVREGVRFAVTERNLPSVSYMNDSVTQVVQQRALGLLNGASGACKISINYYDSVTGAASTGKDSDVIVVAAAYSFNPLGPILKSASAVRLQASSSDVMERCPIGGCPAASNPAAAACP